jgi:hypothetical protein
VSDLEIRSLRDAIEVSRRENREDFRVLHGKFDHIMQNGCSFAATHKQVAQDVREMQRAMWRWTGGIALAAFVVSVLGATVAKRLF